MGKKWSHDTKKYSTGFYDSCDEQRTTTMLTVTIDTETGEAICQNDCELKCTGTYFVGDSVTQTIYLGSCSDWDGNGDKTIDFHTMQQRLITCTGDWASVQVAETENCIKSLPPGTHFVIQDPNKPWPRLKIK